MAYRRKQGIAKFSTFEEIPIHQPNPNPNPDLNPPHHDHVINDSSSSLAAQAILASAVHRDSSSVSSAYVHHKDYPYEYTSLRTSNESKGFWGVLAQKAKSVLDDDNNSQQFETTDRPKPQMPETTPGPQLYQPYQSLDRSKKMDNPRLRKGLNALSNSLNHIGDTIGNAFEEGRTIVENKTQGIIQETRKLHIRRKGNGSEEQNHIPGAHNPWQQPSVQSTDPKQQTNSETQLKASRDVAMATAAKAKLILRELKTVKADLAFAKERCSQLEEENKILREGREKGINAADDDMIRLQLETLLAEKARLAHENSVYARENRFLREIVEYHQLTMQGVVFLDEGIEEVTEDDPFPEVSRMLSITPPSPSFTRSPTETSPSVTLPLETDVSQSKTPLHELQIETPQKDDPQKDKPKNLIFTA